MTSKLTIEQRLEQLEKENEIAQPQPPKKAKIQRVAHHLRNRMHVTKHFVPKLISLGPIHHGAQELQLGEKYKQRWAARYIENSGQTPQALHKRVVDDFENEKNLFDDDLLSVSAQQYQKQGFTTEEEKIQWMLFVDGCALLQILEHASLHVPEKMNVKGDQLVLVMGDVLLLENQLPFSLLKLLWKNNDRDEKMLMKTMKAFLSVTTEEYIFEIEVEFPEPTHLLDFQRSIILYDPNKKPVQSWTFININKLSGMVYGASSRSRNMKELKEAGIIRLKSSKTRWPRDISFSYGRIYSELTLPEIVVDSTLLNLIAYEMCPDFENDYGFSSYVSFLDSLIDHADDLKALRSKQILLNPSGSDEEVANLFNTLGNDLIVPDMVNYPDVIEEIQKHCSNYKCRIWLALGYHTYFSNPWSIIALFAAVLGLSLTFVQTWYTSHPPK